MVNVGKTDNIPEKNPNQWNFNSKMNSVKTYINSIYNSDGNPEISSVSEETHLHWALNDIDAWYNEVKDKLDEDQKKEVLNYIQTQREVLGKSNFIKEEEQKTGGVWRVATGVKTGWRPE